jgi:ankyrin repeat protein
MQGDGLVKPIGSETAQPLSQLPTDILVGIFEWIDASSIDRCLLKQTCSRIKWVFTQHIKAMDTIIATAPFTHNLAAILHRLPELTNNAIWFLKVHCAKQGMLANFNTLHAIKGPFHDSFVSLSAKGGHTECMMALLNMSPEAKRPAICDSALISACIGGNLDTVNQLLVLGANPNLPVMNAARFGHLDVVKRLQHSGADIFANDHMPLRFACQNGRLHVVKYLHEQKSDIRANMNQPIVLACKHGHLEVAKYLWSQGANDFRNFDASCLMTVACQEGHLEIVKFLYSVGVSVTATNTVPIYYAVSGGHVELVKYLLSKGADRDIVNGGSFKVAAMTSDDLEFVKLLYSPNLKVEVVADSFVGACRAGHLEVAQFISSLPRNDLSSHMQQALQVACGNGHLEIVELLVSLNVDIHVSVNHTFGRACLYGHLNIVQFLFSLGVDSLVKNGNAFVKACEGGHMDIVVYIYSK